MNRWPLALAIVLFPAFLSAGNGSVNNDFLGCDCTRGGEPPAEPEPIGDVPRVPAMVRLVQTRFVRHLTDIPNERAAGLRGTDLGVPFTRDDKLVFLFGDSYTTDRDDETMDSAAYVDSDGQLKWFTDPSGRFIRLDKNTTGMEVPVEGIPDGDKTYVFFSDGWSDDAQRHSHSVLSVMNGLDFAGLQRVYAVRSDKFINISRVEYAGQHYLFGSGLYRKSSVYLARATDLTRRDQWEYRHASGAWAAGDEGAAGQMVADNCVGELSVRFEPALGLFLMAYNCTDGIKLRTAWTPEGPWSDAIVLTTNDEAHGVYSHGPNDDLGDGANPGYGGLYGPYIVPEWTKTETNGDVTISYTLSTWVPYQAQVVSSTLRLLP